jgi:hypothetical protein
MDGGLNDESTAPLTRKGKEERHPMIQQVLNIAAWAHNRIFRLALAVAESPVRRDQRGVVLVDWLLLLAAVGLIAAMVYNIAKPSLEISVTTMWNTNIRDMITKFVGYKN